MDGESVTNSATTEIIPVDFDSSVVGVQKEIAEDSQEDKSSEKSEEERKSEEGSHRSSEIVRVNRDTEITDDSEVIRRSTAVNNLEDEVESPALLASGKSNENENEDKKEDNQ